ncbi:hypothetical protein LTR49_021835 [Elasticomyces elasticus]|nr:hypothetical protein LTR49_021835 [Elasticomyces elasticus]
MTFSRYFQKHGVANRLEQRSLLIAVNAVAALFIFFFGKITEGLIVGHTHRLLPRYDQGVMGGINSARHYASLMIFGHYDESDGLVKVDDPLLQGGLAHSLALFLVDGLVTGTAAFRRSV